MKEMDMFGSKHVCGMSERGYALYKAFITELCVMPEEKRYNNSYDVKEAFGRALDRLPETVKEEVNRKSGFSKIGSSPKPNWYYSADEDFIGFTSRLFCEL